MAAPRPDLRRGEILDYADQTTDREAAAKYGIHPVTVARWRRLRRQGRLVIPKAAVPGDPVTVVDAPVKAQAPRRDHGPCLGCEGSGRFMVNGMAHGDCEACAGTGRRPKPGPVFRPAPLARRGVKAGFE